MRMKRNVPSWLGNVEQMSDERMVKKKNGGRRSRETYEDSPEGMCEEVDDSG